MRTGVCRPLQQQGLLVEASRHGKRVKRLGRPADQRKALVRSLTTQVLDKGKIRTTAVRAGLAVAACSGAIQLTPSAVQIKAMAIRKYVDKMVMLAKEGSLHSRRQVSRLTCCTFPAACTGLCGLLKQHLDSGATAPDGVVLCGRRR